jgi:hypothetical protein
LKRRQVDEVYDGKVNSVTWSGKASDFSSDSTGRWAPSTISLTRKTDWIGKATEILTTTVKIKRTVFNPALSDDDFKTTIVLPHGFPVNIVDASHLPYHWDGTKATPTIVKNELASPQELTKRQDHQTGLILFVANLILVLALGCWFVWKNARRGRAKQ